MSATGRGGAALALPGLEKTIGRHPDDFYRTPGWAVDAILPHLRPPRRFVDPGCGDGAIAARVIARWPSAEPILVERDEARAREATARLGCHVWRGDYLRRGSIWEPDGVDLVIGNPPYVEALEFVVRSLEFVEPAGGEVSLLLRMGFLEAELGSERDEFLEEHPPDVFPLGRRPGFRGPGGGSDSAPYGWMVWGPGRGGRCKRLRSPGRAA